MQNSDFFGRGIFFKLFLLISPVVLLLLFPVYVNGAACDPTSVEVCVAVDDVSDVWINDAYIGQFNYVNWDEDGVYPTCVTINPDIIEETGNVVSIKVRNTECCEIWGSWTIQSFCSDGSTSCLSSDDEGMRLYPVLTPSTDPPPDDSSGNEWWEMAYEDTDLSPWQDAVVDTGTIYGKLIYNPCTGTRLQPLSYDSGGNAEDPDMHIYMRQPFSLTPVPTLPPTNFTISKSAAPTTDIDTQDRVTYTLLVCNEGQYTQDPVTLTDVFDSGFSFDGPYGGDCASYGDGGPCYENAGSGRFTVKWQRGFPGMECVTLTARVVDYWVDSSEWCEYRDNVAGITWDSAAVHPSSNTVTVQMICPGTFTPTMTISPTHSITMTHTFSPTRTNTPTITVTPTKTRIPTYTHSPTEYPTHYTVTSTYTITLTHTLTATLTATNTPTPTVTETWVNAVELVKTQDKDQVPLGDTVQYCIQFTNVGENQANFTIWDTIPGPLDFLWCTENCDGPVTYDTGALADQCPGSPGDDCRVISWQFVDVPPGASGQVCFWVLAARFQTVHTPWGVESVYARTDEPRLPQSYEKMAGYYRGYGGFQGL